ncbi:hypothetical protein [Brevibacterium samyangense]|uniref:Uncharacterized protein n=1 Tax=Brevibacterium samyangense TaxID=366888 RepID=A0ABP5ELY8_9MICO
MSALKGHAGSGSGSPSPSEAAAADGGQASSPTPSTAKPTFHREDGMTIQCRDADGNTKPAHSSLDDIWEFEASGRVECDVSFKSFSRSYTTTETERDAIEEADYDDVDSLDTLYSLCAEAYLGDYEETLPWSPAQIQEARGAFVLCPDHPERDEVEERMQQGEEEEKARERGEIFGSGTYRVGEDISPGTYVTESDSGFDGCYWERLDSAGNIIDNNFIRSGFRAEVTIRESDYSFSTERCGEWRKQN